MALYHSVPQSEQDFERCDEDEKNQCCTEDQRPTGRLTHQRLHSQSHLRTIFHILLLLFSAAFWAASYLQNSHSLNIDLKRVSAYSPVLEDESISLIDTQVSGALFPKRDGSDLLGRAKPGAETDELWEDFEYQRMFAISSEQVRKLGKDPAKTIKFPPESGLGDDAYMGALDIFHQIHCLNVLRKEAFKDYYWNEEKSTNEQRSSRGHSDFFWVHMRHCTDMILQSLMCSANTEMITMTWMETQENPWPDFNVNKKCIDFEAVKKWRDDHSEPKEKIMALKKPYDLVQIDPQYWELFGNSTPSLGHDHG